MSPEDRAEERENEILALQSVYEDELILDETSEFPKLIVAISATAVDKPEHHVGLELVAYYDESYPDTEINAHIQFEEQCLLSSLFREKLNNIVETEKSSGVGSPVVYNIVSALHEEVQNIVDNWSNVDLLEQERKKLIEEEEHKRKVIGTAVTPETFLEWKLLFQKELDEQKRIKASRIVVEKKATGRELFIHDSGLDESDLSFLEDDVSSITTATADLGVEVDASLFEMDDLDLLDVDLSD